ncbi:MAG: hypothetical protein COB35_10655 [Gammaproteobacteria bacterium]|nr:MAG: hypothetical protein COB35_10655 [Gammaproteobacteria bacterium]
MNKLFNTLLFLFALLLLSQKCNAETIKLISNINTEMNPKYDSNPINRVGYNNKLYFSADDFLCTLVFHF